MKKNRTVRFDPEFEQVLIEQAKARGLSFSEYIRNGMRFAQSKGFRGILEWKKEKEMA